MKSTYKDYSGIYFCLAVNKHFLFVIFSRVGGRKYLLVSGQSDESIGFTLIYIYYLSINTLSSRIHFRKFLPNI